MLVSEASARLGPSIASAIEGRGFEHLTPVQEAVLAPDIEGRDLRITSETGSGKTVAIGFVLRDVLAKGGALPRALVVTPTRELAKQVEEELSWLFAGLGTKVASVTGGASFRDERRALGREPALVVGTPGRLLDHLRRGSILPSELGAVVLDEADRLLDLGFRDDIEAILEHAPEGHATHLVSATFAGEVRKLADRVQTNPHHVQGTPLGRANEDIEHVIHYVAAEEKLHAVVNLLLATPASQTLVFAKTRADVAELCDALRDAGFIVGMLSGEMDQPERHRALAAFKRGNLDALVATDVAARGIDVQDIGRVIHAEPPLDVDAYTHRSGRTGRAGRKGTSSVIATPANLSRTKRLLERAGVTFRLEPIPTPDAIRAMRDERVIDLLTRAPEPEATEATEEPDQHLAALAQRIIAAGEVERSIARLLLRARARGPAEPRELSAMIPPERKSRARGAPGGPGDVGEGPSEGRRTESVRPPRSAADWVAFRVSWGQAHGADARRLLAMVCRRGDIKSPDVGAIRVARTYSVVEIAATIAGAFESATRDPDPRDPRATIRRAAPDESPPRPERIAGPHAAYGRPPGARYDASSGPDRPHRGGPRPFEGSDRPHRGSERPPFKPHGRPFEGSARPRPVVVAEKSWPGTAERPRPVIVAEKSRPGSADKPRAGVPEKSRPGTADKPRAGAPEKSRPGTAERSRPGAAERPRPGAERPRRPGPPPARKPPPKARPNKHR